MLGEHLVVRYARTTFQRSLSGFIEPRRPPRPPPHPILLYLHVPFCEVPCVYCSFHRVAYREDIARPYYRALREEMRLYADRGFRFDGLSVGGGTPTVIPEELAQTIRLARELWSIPEVTVETNPSHLTPANVSLLRDTGVQRISVGVQSLRPEVLEALGRLRYGSPQEIRDTLQRVRGVFPTLNVDLIFGYPGQTAAQLAPEVRELRGLGVDQLTFYPLMYSRLTRKALRRRMHGSPTEPLESLYRVIREELDSEYRTSTAWCFSRRRGAAVDEYITGRDEYAGLGAGSFGLVGGTLWATTFSIPAYIRRAQERQSALVLCRPFRPLEHAHYTFLMGLFGGSPRLGAMIRAIPPTAAPALALMMGAAAALGLLGRARGRTAATTRGSYASVLLMREFFQGVNDFRDACRGVSTA